MAAAVAVVASGSGCQLALHDCCSLTLLVAASVQLALLCRFARLRETAFEYAFLLKTAGML
jgi:hypothetical protein